MTGRARILRKPTLWSAGVEYFGESPLERSTISRYRSGWNLAQEFFGADTPLADIGPVQAEAFVRSLGPGRTASTLRNLTAGLKAICQRAVRRHQIESNPFADLSWVFAEMDPARKIIEEDDEPVVPFTEEEQGRLLETYTSPLRIGIVLGLRCGLRRSEVLGLRVEDLKLDAHPYELHVRRRLSRGQLGPVKSKAGRRTIPLSYQTRSILKVWLGVLRDGPLVVPYHSEDRFSRDFKFLMHKAGVTNGSNQPFHRCRHTFASRAIAAGIPVDIVSMWLGHSSTAVTRRVYVHFIPDSDHSDLIQRLDVVE